MSEFPKPKYKKGDKVFHPSKSFSTKHIVCPDCLGTKKWIVIFADGDTQEVDCQTCKSGFYGPSGSITYQHWEPTVQHLTIGSIKFDDEKFKYMCEETGVGSGTVYDEQKLYLNKDHAKDRAIQIHKEWMKQLARNNFSKKFNGAKQIEDMLSTFGYTRKALFEKKRKFIEWAEISELTKTKGKKK